MKQNNIFNISRFVIISMCPLTVCVIVLTTLHKWRSEFETASSEGSEYDSIHSFLRQIRERAEGTKGRKKRRKKGES